MVTRSTLRVVGPAGEQRLQDAGERALADGHAAGHADDVRHLRGQRAEERGRRLVQVLGGRDVQVEQAGERQVDRRDLVEVDALVDAAQRLEVVLAQRQRGGRTQRRPLVAVEGQVAVAPCRVRFDAVTGPDPTLAA